MQKAQLIAAACLVSSLSAILYGQDGHAEDDAAIRALVKQYLAARELRDAKKVESLFCSDADQLVSSGEWRKGRSALVQGVLASSQATGGKRTISITSIRFLTPDVAVADGNYDLSGLTGGESRHMWTTFVMKHEREGWRIAAIRNMRPAAPVPSK